MRTSPYAGMALALGLLLGASSMANAEPEVIRDDEPAISQKLVTPVRKWSDSSVQTKAAVLLLHGFPEHGLLYDELAKRLAADGYVVYAPDMRGLGRAYMRGEKKVEYFEHADYDVATLAERIRKEHKGIPLVVGGESMGGALAIRLAATRPELVDAVMVSGPALKLEHHYARLIPNSLVNVLTLRKVKVDFSGQLKEFFSADDRVVKELLLDPLVRKSFDVSELLQARRFPKTTEKYVGEIPADKPVFVLQAADDRQTDPRVLRLFDAKLKSRSITYVIYGSGGHTLLQTRYLDDFAANAVLKWLNEKVAVAK